MSAFFSRSKTAAVVGILPYFAGFFITFALRDSSSRTAKLVSMLELLYVAPSQTRFVS
jgi:hypothetical protein